MNLHHGQPGGQPPYFSGMGQMMPPSSVPMPQSLVQAPPPPNTVGGDVMVVGEPSLMGGDFGEEDERLITRLENNQFDLNISMANPNSHQQQRLQRMNSNNSSFPNLNNEQVQQQQAQSQAMFPPSQQKFQQFNPMGQINEFPSRPPSLQSQLSQPIASQSHYIPPMPPRPLSTSHIQHSNVTPSQLILDQQQIINTNVSSTNRISTPSPNTSNQQTTTTPTNSSAVPLLNSSLLNNMVIQPNNLASMSNNPNSPPVLLQQQQHPSPSLTPTQQLCQQQFQSISSSTPTNRSNEDESLNTSNTELILNSSTNELNNNNSTNTNDTLNESNLDNLNNDNKSPNSTNMNKLNNDSFSKLKNTNELISLDADASLINGLMGAPPPPLPQQQPSTSSSSIASSSSSSPTLFASIQSNLNHPQQQIVNLNAATAANSSAASNSGSLSLTNCSPPNTNSTKPTSDQSLGQQSQAIY